MSDKIAAKCDRCNKATTGKIYDPYWCADCKIEELQEKANFYKESYEHAEEARSEWVRKYNDESIQKTKYRHAFEALVEQIKKN
jgi:hypothetical protein